MSNCHKLSIQHFIWDFDGTLFDTYPFMSGAFHRALQDFGFEEPREVVESFMKVSVPFMIAHYRQKFGFGDDLLACYREHYTDFEKLQAKPFPDAFTTCSALHGSGAKHYLYTHKDNRAYGLMANFGFEPLFTDIITAEDGFPAKPDPAAILYLLDKHAIPPEQALMTGDREIDILAAKNAGIAGCYINPHRPCRIAEFSVRTLSEMLELFL